MTEHTAGVIGLVVLSPVVAALGVAYVRATLAGGRRAEEDEGSAGLQLLVAVPGLLLALLVVVKLAGILSTVPGHS